MYQLELQFILLLNMALIVWLHASIGRNKSVLFQRKGADTGGRTGQFISGAVYGVARRQLTNAKITIMQLYPSFHMLTSQKYHTTKHINRRDIKVE